MRKAASLSSLSSFSSSSFLDFYFLLPSFSSSSFSCQGQDQQPDGEAPAPGVAVQQRGRGRDLARPNHQGDQQERHHDSELYSLLVLFFSFHRVVPTRSQPELLTSRSLFPSPSPSPTARPSLHSFSLTFLLLCFPVMYCRDLDDLLELELRLLIFFQPLSKSTRCATSTTRSTSC